MSAILKFDFKKENNYIFQKKIFKLHKQDTILHVTVTFSLKQGQRRSSSGPIWVPLSHSKEWVFLKKGFL